MKDDMKILVAYDGSDQSKNALSEAIQIAKKFSGALTVFHCYWNESLEASMLMMKENEKRLKEASIKYEYKNDRTNTPPTRILSVADEGGFDLIVIGSRGMGGARAWMLGSVSNKVTAEANVPVLVVK